MSLIAKIEEALASFALEKVNISELLGRPKEEWSMALSEKNIEMNWQFPDNLVIKGNPVLLHSIFNNLTENAIRYAGEHIKINISVFNEDYKFYYFSFYDTGAGIGDEGHLNRIFERFYRVQEGHTHEAGGSEPGPVHRQECGQFHKGNILTKNRKGGGLEFIF